MPGMNVRGDRHLNFTPEEAGAWLGRVEARHHAHADLGNDAAIARVMGVVALFAVLALIGAAFSGPPQRQMASDVTRSTLQTRTAATEQTQRADIQRQEAISHEAPRPVAHLPRGWFYGRIHGDLPLQDREGRSIGVLPDGATFFGTGAASEVQIIVASDGGAWGYGELEMPDDVRNVPIAAPVKPEFEKAATLIGQIEASGVAEVLRRSPRPDPEYGYLPAGWTVDCLDQDAPLAYGVYGTKIGTIPKGTCLLYEIADVGGWRLVVTLDGGYRGCAHIPLLYEVPKRTPMRPEYRGAVALIHRLADGRASADGG